MRAMRERERERNRKRNRKKENVIFKIIKIK